MNPNRSQVGAASKPSQLFMIWVVLVVCLFGTAHSARGQSYPYYLVGGNGKSGLGGAIGNAGLSLGDSGTNITGQLGRGRSGFFNDVLVIYIDTGSGGFTNTASFSDGADPIRRAISGFDGGANRSVLRMETGFQPGYAITMAPGATGSAGVWQLAGGGNNSLLFITNITLSPLVTSNAPYYNFSFDIASIGLPYFSGATFRYFGTYITTNGYRSDEALAGDVAGTVGWNPFTNTYVTSYTIQGSAAGSTGNALAYNWTTFAGVAGYGEVDGVGTTATFQEPIGMVADGTGNLFVSDYRGHTIRKITPGGVVTTIAGQPGNGNYLDGTNLTAVFVDPNDITMDTNGNLYLIDGPAVRRIAPVGTNWVVTSLAGRQFGSADGTNFHAQFSGTASGITADNSTNLYVADTGNHTIRKIAANGTNWVVTTITGKAGTPGSADGTNSGALFSSPSDVAADQQGNLYVADAGNNTIRKLSPLGTNWVVTTIAGTAGMAGHADGTNGAASFSFPGGYYYAPRLAIDTNGVLYVPDSLTIRKVTPSGTNWVVTTFAGVVYSPGNTDGTGTNASFKYPVGMAVDGSGNIFVGDDLADTVRKITPAAVVSTLAGVPLAGAGSQNGVGATARFDGPQACAVDGSGNIYVADSGNDTVRMITPAGLVTTPAGLAGANGSTDGAGSNARFFGNFGVAVDSAGNAYAADTFNYTIRKITPAGQVTTIAGTAHVPGSADGTNGSALFNYPISLAVDPGGNIYVADALNCTIRKITPVGTNWVTTTIAGTVGVRGNADGTNSAGLFGSTRNIAFAGYNTGPRGLAVDNLTNIYVADDDNGSIRMIRPVGTNWVVSTIASFGFNTSPMGVAVDTSGNVYVCNNGGGQTTIVMKLTPQAAGWTTSIIGGGQGISSADGAGNQAQFNYPDGIAVNQQGEVFVADTGNNTIRAGVFSQYGTASLTGYTPGAMNATLTVTVTPPEANGQWHFPWEQGWHNSGDTVNKLMAGNYPVVFRSIPGWVAYPQSLTVVLTNNSATLITNQFFPSAGADTNNGAGTLVVNLGVNPPPGAGWRFIGDNGAYLPSGYTTNLTAGTYLIEFAAVSGRTKPGSLSLPVTAGQPTYINVSYLLAGTAPANAVLPFLVPTANVTNVAQYPFGYCGQLQSDVGYGSGAAVSTNVVLTVAHLVFDDQTLGYVSGAYWFVQREAGIQEPLPQAARGWYVLSGYAAQRTNDIESGYSPDQSTPPSRNMDVAALYFLSPVAGGGEGGYLPSDAVPNLWLTGSALKMLAGYPVDGSQFGVAVNAGQMYQTTPQASTLTIDPNSVPGQQEVYQAPWFFSYPGNSGGPLYVQLNGYYYPAGVYLGTLYSGSTPVASLVRGIDSAVVNLITNAQTLGDAGTNSTGGGVTVLSSSLALGGGGFMQWNISPASAVRAGAAWQVAGESSYSTATNYTEVINTTNARTVHFKPIPGWQAPGDQIVSVPQGYLTVYGATYTVSNPVFSYNPALGIGFGGTTGTVYRIEMRTNLVAGSWVPVATNTVTNAGFNLVLPRSVFTNRAGYYRAVWLQ